MNGPFKESIFLEVSSEFSLILPLNEKPVKGKLFSEKNILKMMTFVFNQNCFYITREIQEKRKLFNLFFLITRILFLGSKQKQGRREEVFFYFQRGLSTQWDLKRHWKP